LVAHHAAESTGLLVARRGPIEKRVVLDHGVPVECRSNLAHETFSRFLATAGRLTDGDANATLSRSLARGVLLGAILLEEGRMDAVELQRLLQQSLARKLFDLFTWRDGEVTFESGEFTTPAALKVKVARLVLTGIERFVPQETIDAAIGPHAGTLFTRHPDAAALAEELRPTPRERALLAVLEPPRRLEELLPLTGLALDELSRQIWGLALLGFVVPADRLPSLARPADALPGAAPPPPTPVSGQAPPSPVVAAAAIPPSPQPAPPALPAPTSTDSGSAFTGEEPARIRERVAAAFAKLREQDPFDLLEAADATTVEEIRARYFAFARQFAPWQFEIPELMSAAPAAEELFAAGALAFARLSDVKNREALRAARRAQSGAQAVAASPLAAASAIPASAPAAAAPPLSSPGATHRTAGPTPTTFRIETDLLDPELQYKKGRALKEAQRWGAALQQFDFAADCDPQNGAYRAEAAHCRFLLAPNSSGGRALDELKEAQRIDPDSITPYLYAGEIAASLGRFDEAETYLRNAARRLGPADRRALDALRDLAKKRKK
ncbi:MAG: DUF4388 domain-containing protein, partial [Thermoanaerobaculia bacterium]